MQCLFNCIAKGTGNFPCFQSSEWLLTQFIIFIWLLLNLENKKNMSTNCDDHCISCVSGDKEQKYKKWHVFSGNPILLHKGTAQTDCPSMAANVQSERSKATMQKNNANELWIFLKREKKKILVFSGAVKDGSDTKLVWGKYRGDTFETCFSQ